VNHIMMEASCEGHSISVRATELEIRRSTAPYHMYHFMKHILHHYSGENILLKMTMFDGSTHTIQNVYVKGDLLHTIAEQWIIQIKGALV
jgi:hypothetical protein